MMQTSLLTVWSWQACEWAQSLGTDVSELPGRRGVAWSGRRAGCVAGNGQAVTQQEVAGR